MGLLSGLLGGGVEERRETRTAFVATGAGTATGRSMRAATRRWPSSR